MIDQFCHCVCTLICLVHSTHHNFAISATFECMCVCKCTVECMYVQHSTHVCLQTLVGSQWAAWYLADMPVLIHMCSDTSCAVEGALYSYSLVVMLVGGWVVGRLL